MANDCLVTKLKGVIDNDSLAKLGSIKINATYKENATDNDLALLLRATEPIKVIAKGNGCVATSIAGLANEDKELTIPVGASYATVYFKNATYPIEITGKYNIVFIDQMSSSNIFTIDLEEVKYASSLSAFTSCKAVGDINVFENNQVIKDLDISDSEAIGNISALASCQNLETLRAARTAIDGDISSLSKLTSLIALEIGNSNIEGSIESFVEGQYDNGRITANYITMPHILTQLKFGGTTYNMPYPSYVSWESRTKMTVIMGGNTYETCSDVYCSGYSQQEAEARWAGKNIVRVDA